MLHRYEQIEMRDNAREYKHLYGVDLALELQKAIKFCELDPLYKNQTGSVNGYLTISPLKDGSLLHLENKFDYLSSGKVKTGYHTLKDSQL